MTTVVAPSKPSTITLPDTIKVKVTDEDIALGSRKNPHDCPRHRALRRWLYLQYGEAANHFRVSFYGDAFINSRRYRQSNLNCIGLILYDMMGWMQPHAFTITKDVPKLSAH